MGLDSLLLFTSFVAGVLTILAPCVLPLLPVIVGGSAGSTNKWYPFILTSSLAASVILFTLLLKASTLLINVPQGFWKGISGGIVLVFGLIWLFPKTWELIAVKLNLLGRSQKGLAAAGAVNSTWGGILMGAALGPVFASCSPTYFVILATVLPVSFGLGLIYLIVYGIGLAVMLGLIGFFGQKLTTKLGWAADPHGLFKKIMGILLILVGLAVITGYDKKIETAVLDAGFGVTQLELDLLDQMDDKMKEMDKVLEETDKGAGLLPFLYEAPDLVGLENWINTEPIGSLEELRGKVVLIDFWTYSCINCIRTLPFLQSWHEKYADDGLVILGLHAPEFQFEKIFKNVEKATEDFGLTYPVVQDNDFKTWRAYNNRFWPAKYLIDQNGVVRYTRFGEGAYDETEANIVYLLETAMEEGEVEEPRVEHRKVGTHETYIGLRRRENFVKNPDADLGRNQWTLTGSWEVDGEKATSTEADSGIRMNFHAASANLVIGGAGDVVVTIDGEITNTFKIDGEKLYNVADFDGVYTTHEIELTFKEPGVQIFAWTFG